MKNDKLHNLISELSREELQSLRGIVSRKLASNRILTPECQAKMQAGRGKNKQGRPKGSTNLKQKPAVSD